ncbi:MAG: hypothetical protein LBT53_04210 [Puniceicoccales bacterium]|nr:hypothetical protein [Puniceicoccales bacterium]
MKSAPVSFFSTAARLLGVSSLLALVAAAPLQAAKVQPKAFPNAGVFGVKVAGTSQAFFGRADQVLSVAFQEYTTGTLFVSEVTLDMSGSNQLLRLYYARPFSAADAARQSENAAAAAGEISGGLIAPSAPALPSEVTEADAKVQRSYARARAGLVLKSYPVTTHAKTVEFSVGSKEELVSFFNSFQNLYVGYPVRVSRQFVTTTAAADSAANPNDTLYVNRIGGTLFTLE